MKNLTHLIKYFSSWVKLQKSVAWLLRFKDWLRSRATKRKEWHQTFPQLGNDNKQVPMEKGTEGFQGSTVNKYLSVNDISQAVLEIIKFCQRKRFPEELSSLAKGQPVKRSSHLHKLCPQLQGGVLRVGGRLIRLSMPEEQKHPIILVKDLHISELLVGHVHQKVGHGGCNHMLSKLREKYWIVGVSSAIRKVLSECVRCRRLNALPPHQQMAELPQERIIPDKPPFTRVGVDCLARLK